MTTLICEYCEMNFKNQSLLDKHLSDSASCKKYKCVLFTCLKCQYKTKGIRKIESHVSSCEEPENFETNELGDKKIIEKLLTLIKLEKFKSKFYKNIIDRNTGIKLDDIDINMFEPIELENVDKNTFSDRLFDVKQPLATVLDDVSEEKRRPDKKHVYRKIGKNLASEPTDEEVQDKIKKVDEMRLMEINELKYRQKFNKSATETEDIDDVEDAGEESEAPSSPKRNRRLLAIEPMVNCVDETENHEETDVDACLTFIKNSKKYTKKLENILKINQRIFGDVSYQEYKRNLEKIRDTLSETFKAKGWNDKKISEHISKCLSPMDKRIILYGNNFEENLEIDLINKLKASLFLSINFPKTFTPINKDEIFSHFNNYGTAIFPIKDNIDRILFNPYGFNNIVYVSVEKGCKDDPYSYYTFTGYKNNLRLWNMDCRLAIFSESFINNVRPNMINLFRSIYKIVFSDNDFRENYINSTSELISKDCEQLLSNIMILSNPIEFRNLLREVVKEKATYESTEFDKFDLTSDDKALKRKLRKQNDVFNIDNILGKGGEDADGDCNIIDIIKQLFDGITTEECIFFYKEIIMRQR
jgi:hypothetical protein